MSRWEWAAIQEDGANLEAAYGPGMTGMVNIGSSCYINAVSLTIILTIIITIILTISLEFQSIQTLCLVSDFVRQFDKDHFPIDAITPEMHEDFNAQTAKLVRSLQSGDYAQVDFLLSPGDLIESL